jgi:hypothetical protein
VARTETLQIRMATDELLRLSAAASARGWTMSQLLRELVRQLPATPPLHASPEQVAPGPVARTQREEASPAAVAPAEEIAPVQPRSYTHPQAAPVPAAISSLEEKGERLANFFGGEVISLEMTAPDPAPAPVEEPAPAEGQISLVSLFPLSAPAESFEAMNELVVRHGSGKDAAASLPCALSSFKNHKSRLKKLVEQAQEQGEA